MFLCVIWDLDGDLVDLEALKERYGAVYETEFLDGTIFTWRPITWAEYRSIVKLYTDEYEREEYVCRLSVLACNNPLWMTENALAGYCSVIAQAIAYYSGFAPDTDQSGNVKPNALVTEMVAAYEQELNSFDEQVLCYITTAFPALKPDEVLSWTTEKILWHFTRAKWVLATFQGVNFENQKPAGGRRK